MLKNYLSYMDKQEISEKYIGLDVLRKKYSPENYFTQ